MKLVFQLQRPWLDGPSPGSDTRKKQHPNIVEEWSPASLEVIFLMLAVVLELQERGVGIGQESPVTACSLWIPWCITILSPWEDSDWDTAHLFSWGSCDLAQPPAENCPGKVGLGGILGVVKASRPEQLAVTVRSKGWRYLKPPSTTNNECEAKIKFSKLRLIFFFKEQLLTNCVRRLMCLSTPLYRTIFKSPYCIKGCTKGMQSKTVGNEMYYRGGEIIINN